MPPEPENTLEIEEFDSLSSYVRSRIKNFSRSQRDVAEYVVDHLDEVAFHTAEELARRAGTSSSTVVRFSQNLGFVGFPELQDAVRDEYRCKRAVATTLKLSVAPTATDGSLAADISNLNETVERLDRDQVERALDLISRADSLLICGSEQMAFFASYLKYLLKSLDIASELIASASADSLARVTRISPETLVIALASGRTHPLVVRTLEVARQRGAASLAIADASASSVTQIAEHALYYSSTSPSFTRSHVALLSLIQALAHELQAKQTDHTANAIRAFKHQK